MIMETEHLKNHGEDWKHILSFFVFFTITLALVGIYVFSVVDGVEIYPVDAGSENGATEEGRIKNAAADIAKSEAALKNLLESKSKIADPSK